MGRGGSRDPSDYALPDFGSHHQLNRGERILMEGLATAIPLGVAFRGLRALNWLVKGAKPIRTVRRGRKITIYRQLPGYTGRGGIISRIDYRNRAGLYEKVRLPDRAIRVIWKDTSKKISRTFPGRVFTKVQRTRAFFDGPVPYAFERLSPPWLRLGVAAYGGYRWLSSFGDKSIPGPKPVLPEKEYPRPPWDHFEPGLTQSTPLARLAEIRDRPYRMRLDRSGALLRPLFLKPKASPRPQIKSKKRCPPGHRWSSRLQKCVRVNGRRA